MRRSHETPLHKDVRRFESFYSARNRIENRDLNCLSMALLEIKNLKLDFMSGDIPLRAVDDVSFQLEPGETVCLVGESGCGKSVTALSIARLVPSPPAQYAGGEILLNGEDVLRMTQPE